MLSKGGEVREDDRIREDVEEEDKDAEEEEECSVGLNAAADAAASSRLLAEDGSDIGDVPARTLELPGFSALPGRSEEAGSWPRSRSVTVAFRACIAESGVEPGSDGRKKFGAGRPDGPTHSQNERKS